MPLKKKPPEISGGHRNDLKFLSILRRVLFKNLFLYDVIITLFILPELLELTRDNNGATPDNRHKTTVLFTGVNKAPFVANSKRQESYGNKLLKKN